MEVFWIMIFVVLVLDSSANRDKDFWYRDAHATILRRLTQPPKFAAAKNAIIFVADGLGITAVTAARILKGQKKGLQGEDTQLAFERFPDLALMKTYANDGQIADSAASATAMFCGVKANLETIGLNNAGKFEDCISSLNSRVPSIFDWAQQQGKATGFVTTTRVTHGTPAALYAHSASRYWEDDSRLRDESATKPRGGFQNDEPFGGRKVGGVGGRAMCKDITRQLVEDEPGRNINVILGGGRRHWLPQGTRDPEFHSEDGRRQDGKDLIEQWLRDKKKRGHSAEYAWNKAQFDRVDSKKTDFLLGLFDYSHLDFDADRDQGTFGDPSLAEMSIKALEILKRNPHGYVLVVESGRIDHAHHYNNAFRALEEIVAFDEAVALVTSAINLDDTLVIVTSDHSQVMTFGGAGTPRGNAIFGYDVYPSPSDGMPYPTILYGNGPGYRTPEKLLNTSRMPPSSSAFIQPAAVHRPWATHGGEDVPLYAAGPRSYVFHGTIDQSFLAHGIAYSLCIGPFKDNCAETKWVQEEKEDNVICEEKEIRDHNKESRLWRLSAIMSSCCAKCYFNSILIVIFAVYVCM